MMMVEKMAKVVCEINRVSAGRRLQGIKGVQAHTNTDPVSV